MVRLSELSPLHVEALLGALSTGMAPKTVRNTHVVLRRALGQAVRAGLVRRNVASREYVDAPRVTPTEPDALSVAEIERIRKCLPNHPLAAHVLLALGTGLRQGEQLGLAWEDIDLDAGRLHVRKELAYEDGQYDRVDPKTERSKRTVPLSPPLVDAMRTHRERLMARGFIPTTTGPVFVNSHGGPMSGSWLTHQWYGLLALAEVQRRPWKVLRATYGSRLFAAGIPDRTIADLLGHSRTHTTQRHYIATTSEDAMAAIKGIVA
jgi:integrase